MANEKVPREWERKVGWWGSGFKVAGSRSEREFECVCVWCMAWAARAADQDSGCVVSLALVGG